MVRFYNNIKNEEKFMAIVNNLQKVGDIDYEGYDVSDPLDEMNDFMDCVGGQVLHYNTDASFWFSEIYDKWMYDCCSSLSVETINKSFETALNGKHYYDVGNFLDGWDKGLVEYVLNEKEHFAIINDKDDYKKLLYKYKVTVECPNGYYRNEVDLWRPYSLVEEDVADCMENCVMNNYYENDDGDYEDYDGSVINVEEEAAAYAEAWLEELNYEDVNIEYYDN